MPLLKRLSRWLLALFFIVAGLNHFTRPTFYIRMVPPFLPWPEQLVMVSGICEMVFGLLLAVHGWLTATSPRARYATAVGSALLRGLSDRANVGGSTSTFASRFALHRLTFNRLHCYDQVFAPPPYKGEDSHPFRPGRYA